MEEYQQMWGGVWHPHSKIKMINKELEERLRRLESSSGIVVPKDGLRDRRKIEREFSQGGEYEV